MKKLLIIMMLMTSIIYSETINNNNNYFGESDIHFTTMLQFQPKNEIYINPVFIITGTNTGAYFGCGFAIGDDPKSKYYNTQLEENLFTDTFIREVNTSAFIINVGVVSNLNKWLSLTYGLGVIVDNWVNVYKDDSYILSNSGYYNITSSKSESYYTLDLTMLYRFNRITCQTGYAFNVDKGSLILGIGYTFQ